MDRFRSRLTTFLCLFVLFGVNAYICRELFSVEFTERMESIESSYMSISRWATQHWSDLTWFPLWFTGMPFHRVYQPGFHLTVAGLATGLGWTVQHSYHFMAALAYCLGPVTLFWLCYRATGWRGYGFIVGLAFSLISPLCFLAPAMRQDVGGFLNPRRYQDLVHYGEAPHTAALTLIPIAILFLDRAAAGRRWQMLAPAVAALSAVVLTNWPGTVGLAMAVAAWVLSKIGGKRLLSWPILIGIGVVAYLVVCPWVPPSILMAVQKNAQLSDGTTLGRHWGWFAGFAVVLGLLHLALERIRADRWLRFFVYFTLISGTAVLVNEWAQIRLLPQPNRFQLELEMALLGALVYAVVLAWRRWPRWIRVASVVAFVLFCVVQVRNYRRYARIETQPIDITRTIEYRMAKWFDGNMHGQRIFAPGNVSLWMNMFTDVPQTVGCCDQSVPTFEHRVAFYTIYTGQNAGTRDAEISLLWLKAYGANAVGVTGPKSTENIKPFRNPEKFRGVLPELWRDGDDVVYGIPRRSSSLAFVMAPSQVVARAPIHGLDVEPLIPYVAAMESPDVPAASFQWLNQHQARIEADLSGGQVLSAQITYDPGWRASIGSVEQPIASDALGLMVIRPECRGHCSIDLVYDGGREGKLTRVAQVFGIVLWLGWPIGVRRKHL